MMSPMNRWLTASVSSLILLFNSEICPVQAQGGGGTSIQSAMWRKPAPAATTFVYYGTWTIFPGWQATFKNLKVVCDRVNLVNGQWVPVANSDVLMTTFTPNAGGNGGTYGLAAPGGAAEQSINLPAGSNIIYRARLLADLVNPPPGAPPASTTNIQLGFSIEYITH